MFCEKYEEIDTIAKNLNGQGGKMLKTIKRAGSNKSEQDGKNL